MFQNINKSVSTLSAVLALSVAPLAAMAHGPVIVLTNVGGVITTNQIDLTPQSDSASTSDYPVGSAARVFPSQYNAGNLTSFLSGAYATNAPSSLLAIPMVPETVSNDATVKNSGFYGQLEITDGEGNNTLNTGPGYAYGNGGFAAGTVLRVTFASALQYWNGASFGATPNGELLQAIRGSSITAGTGFANTLRSDGVQAGLGLTVSVSSSQNAGSHSQLMYRLMDSLGDSTDTANIADGIYLASFQLSTDNGSLGSSLPYYFLFDKNASGGVTQSELLAANAFVSANLVPEPGVAMLGLPLAGVLLGRRRK